MHKPEPLFDYQGIFPSVQHGTAVHSPSTGRIFYKRRSTAIGQKAISIR